MLGALQKSSSKNRGQLELSIHRERQPDRNHHKGGRSFYFFDFDDNIAFLSTPIFVFHKITGEEKQLTSGEYAKYSKTIGESGPLKDFVIDYDEEIGSYRSFRDQRWNFVQSKLGARFGYKQGFVKDIEMALNHPDYLWKGPSWNCFYHAVYNHRPTSLITARGHDPKTIRSGIDFMVKKKFLPESPNYLSIWPVSHPESRTKLTKDTTVDIPRLKQLAIRASVEKAIEVYGDSPHHRFGMSDDDPKNLEMIVEEMSRLKKEHSKMSFFVFSTENGSYHRLEVFPDYTVDQVVREEKQLSLFLR